MTTLDDWMASDGMPVPGIDPDADWLDGLANHFADRPLTSARLKRVAKRLQDLSKGETPPVEEDPRTTTPGVTDAELLERAVRGARSRSVRRGWKHPRWTAVADVFALGSGYSHALCRRYGLDPDEMVKA